eukprot:9434925-Pyramimonas_sp.AAC.2
MRNCECRRCNGAAKMVLLALSVFVPNFVESRMLQQYVPLKGTSRQNRCVTTSIACLCIIISWHIHISLVANALRSVCQTWVCRRGTDCRTRKWHPSERACVNSRATLAKADRQHNYLPID